MMMVRLLLKLRFYRCTKVVNKNISDLTGIEAFVNLKSLNCFDNQLTSLDVSSNTALKRLICSRNQLKECSHNTALIRLDCINSQA